MIFSNCDISHQATECLCNLLQKHPEMRSANQAIALVSGIVDFFSDQKELDDLNAFLTDKFTVVAETDRREYGDFQTNANLARQVAQLVCNNGYRPTIVIEPTFGRGSFVLAALSAFPELQQVIGFEIYETYVFETKFAIIDYFLSHPDANKPEIRLYHQDVFTVDFQKVIDKNLACEVLVLGNPPWVTNAELGSLSSANLPQKSNFRNLNGLDAMTGKGNFDIGEYITLALLQAFQVHSGQMAFLVKNAVVKNLVFNQKKAPLAIGGMRQLTIDAKKEFGAAVEASLFLCQFSKKPEFQCGLATFQSPDILQAAFGWVDNQFVSNTHKYQAVKDIDGVCPMEWRQGLKHDCSAIMEFERVNGHFSGSTGAEIHLENDLVFGILKSSELKGGVVSKAKKYTIVTQRKVGQDTAYIERHFPETYSYLDANRDKFANRKSSIYRGKPAFSIFGIGDYSFLPYKVAISGLYKSPSFTLVLPENGKPNMLDDTCYFIGFEHLNDAVITFCLLNSKLVLDLLDAIAFSDAKRVFTKEILMRINLLKVAELITPEEVSTILSRNKIDHTIQPEDLHTFARFQQGSEQLQLF